MPEKAAAKKATFGADRTGTARLTINRQYGLEPLECPSTGALFEHIDRGSTIDEFLEWFPSVSREQVHRVLAFARSSLEQPTAGA
ncbi:MAG: DUF433 domain-containing protein [Bryobacteraceae bacterium]|jgi:hypothetical protein